MGTGADDTDQNGGIGHIPVATNVVSLGDARDVRRRARSLYWQCWTIQEISDELGLKYDTVKSWKSRGKWDEASPLARCEDAVEAQFIARVQKGKYSGADVRDIDLLGRQMERFARIRKFDGEGGNEADLNPKVRNRNAGEKKQHVKNLITHDMAQKLIAAIEASLLGYQQHWLKFASLRTRMILKSRQIGATWYFAREALLMALKTGNNQIFLSASRNQANIFRQYIVALVQSVCEIKLTGSPMVLNRTDEDGDAMEPVELHFLGTNFRTAQGYHGDVYIDECFWIHGFEELNKVASGMATHKRYRKTYFSTPSSIQHEAYPMWSGERYNRKRAKDSQAKFDLSIDALKDGVIGKDGIFRQIVTIHHANDNGAEEAGFFDIDELRIEYSTDEFANLFECTFIDDARSWFPMSMLLPCGTDTWGKWRDFNAKIARPFGNKEVWVGYDPQASEDGDNAALVVVAPPEKPGGKFRVLEKKQFRGSSFAAQAAEIKRITQRYNVTHIAIDSSGIGAAVHELVKAFFPRVVAISYSLPVKVQLVTKAKDVISNRRIEWEAGWRDMTMAFHSIHPKLSGSQESITFVAKRSELTGHGDLAWAVMHVLINEPLGAGHGLLPVSSVLVA